MHPRCTPEGIRSRHLPDQIQDFAVPSWPTRLVLPGEPCPIGGEMPSMPSKDGLGLYNEEGVLPIIPRTGQEQPKESISALQFWPADLSLQNGQLLSKSEVFQSEFRAQLESRWDQRQYRKNRDGRVSGMRSGKSIVSTRPRFWRMTACC